MIEACGVAASEVCVIGDHFGHDFTAPILAGMRALLLDANAPAGDAERVRSLADVPGRVGSPSRIQA